MSSLFISTASYVNLDSTVRESIIKVKGKNQGRFRKGEQNSYKSSVNYRKVWSTQTLCR